MEKPTRKAHQKIAEFYAKSAGKPLMPEAGIWTYLQDSEQILIDLINGVRPPDDAPGSIEFGPVLYMANNDVSVATRDFLRRMGMPPSKITPQEWQAFLNDIGKAPGLVAGDGTLYIEGVPYAQLDPNWIELSLVYCIFYRTFPNDRYPFVFSPSAPVISIPSTSSLTIAVMGDWGTGPWHDGSYNAPAVLVGNAIRSLDPAPMITMHLGDVYYAGTDFEESPNLLRNFPRGSKYNFTLNSNHEMYDGANGYFKTALFDRTIFSAQHGYSYFAVKFADWVILGLDSAYFDNRNFMYMDGELVDAHQHDFIRSLGITPQQKVLVFTHHNGLRIDGNKLSPPSSGTPLFDQLCNFLDKRTPDVWYYGHVHNGVVYNQSAPGVQDYVTEYGLHPMVRCMGHGSIPYGLGYQVAESTQNFDYYVNTPMPKGNPVQANRLLNGFALLKLSNGTIKEDVYEVPSNGSPALRKWTKTTSF